MIHVMMLVILAMCSWHGDFAHSHQYNCCPCFHNPDNPFHIQSKRVDHGGKEIMHRSDIERPLGVRSMMYLGGLRRCVSEKAKFSQINVIQAIIHDALFTYL